MANRLTEGKYQIPRHIGYLSKKLARAVVQPDSRVLVQLPVRHGKSEAISHWLPVWIFHLWSHMKVVLCAYEADFAASWGQKVRDSINLYEDQLNCRVSSGSSARGRWDTTDGSSMFTAGVGGPITGKGADVLIVDDPVKNFDEANSEVFRERNWNWWTKTAYPRLEPGASAIILMARWHHDDLAGRIIQDVKDGGEPWDVITIPAIAADDDVLGRKPGEALWPKRYDEHRLGIIKRTVGGRGWLSLYQQRPSDDEGGIFKRQWFRYFSVEDKILILHQPDGSTIRYPLDLVMRFQTGDFGATDDKNENDPTVIMDCMLTPGNELLVWGIWRDWCKAPETRAALYSTYHGYRPDYVALEKAHVGISFCQDLIAEGFPIKELTADRSKVSRSMMVSVKMEVGQVYFRKGATWLDDLEEELLHFPTGKHDDQVDTLSYAGMLVSPGGGDWLVPTPIHNKSFLSGYEHIMPSDRDRDDPVKNTADTAVAADVDLEIGKSFSLMRH